MKKGYWISLYVKIDNSENLKKYAETVTPIIKGFGGIPLVRVVNTKHLMVITLVEQLFGNFLVIKKQLSVINQQNIKLDGILQKRLLLDICR